VFASEHVDSNSIDTLLRKCFVANHPKRILSGDPLYFYSTRKYNHLTRTVSGPKAVLTTQTSRKNPTSRRKGKPLSYQMHHAGWNAKDKPYRQKPIIVWRRAVKRTPLRRQWTISEMKYRLTKLKPRKKKYLIYLCNQLIKLISISTKKHIRHTDIYAILNTQRAGWSQTETSAKCSSYKLKSIKINVSEQSR
jgi:hypothetical protein